MTSTSFSQSIGELTKPGGGLDLGPDRARLMVRMLRLLSEGRPLDRERIDAAIADLGDNEATYAQLEAWTERDGDDNIIGLGLTYNPTAHHLTIDGNPMWAWCAMDTLIFPIVLGKKVSVESTAPRTRETVNLKASPSGVTDVRPADAVITFPTRDSGEIDLSTASSIWVTFCHHSFFFPSRASAEEWAAGRDDIEILTLDEGFEVAEAIADAILRYEPAPETQ